MQKEIINRVAKSLLITIDLEDYYPKESFKTIDIKPWLYQELILKEKEFRAHLKKHNWEQYKNCYVAITCTSEAIIPSWAYLLITTYLNSYANLIAVGNTETLITIAYQKIIESINIEELKNKPIIIKGCSKKNIPLTAYTMLINKIKPVAKSIFFGEACSNVPLYKKKK